MTRGAVTAGLVLLAAASAVAMDKDEYDARREQIRAEYAVEKARCKTLDGHDRDLCAVRALGSRDVARAALDARHTPGQESEDKLRLARAQAFYAIERQGCERMAGADKRSCLQQAKAAFAAERQLPRTAAMRAAPPAAKPRNRQHDALYAAGMERCAALEPAASQLCIDDLRRRLARL
jgi:hypothetical protein